MLLLEEIKMDTLTKLFHSTARLTGIVGATLLFSASPVWADKCSKGDRVSLPDCIETQSQENGWWITNNCSHTVTIKFDQPGSDARVDVAPGSPTRSPRMFTSAGKPEAKLSCCPRYNSCSNG